MVCRMNLNLLYSISVGRSLSRRNCEANGGWRCDEPSQSEVNLSCSFSHFADSYLQFTQCLDLGNLFTITITITTIS